MKPNQTRLPAVFLAAALALSLLSGCGADAPEASPTPSPEQSQEAASSQRVEPSQAPSEALPEISKAGDTPEPTGTPAPASPEPAATPEPEPTSAPTPEPAPEPTQSGPEDGSYTAGVVLSGGTGRATVLSPAPLRCANGQFFATIVWSSFNYDYMKVNGVRYDPISSPWNGSAFEIPVAAFDTPLPVIADTVAMSEPHEVEYTLTFDSASLIKQ